MCWTVTNFQLTVALSYVEPIVLGINSPVTLRLLPMKHNINKYFQVVARKVALSGLRQFLATENPLKLVENAFYFIFKDMLKNRQDCEHPRKAQFDIYQAFQWIYCAQAINHLYKEIFSKMEWAIYCPP